MINNNIVDYSSNKYYDSIANNYNQIFNNRILYHESIDRILLKYLIDVDKLLDIGTGDGLRLLKNISNLDSQPDLLVCLEPSSVLFNIAKTTLSGIDYINCRNCKLDSFHSEIKFSHITSLWNVIGHVGEPIHFLKKTFDLLSPGGVFVFDVNNRFNASHYGLINVSINIINELRDYLGKGIFSLKSDISSDFKVYLSSPLKIYKQLIDVGFEVVETFYIDYKTGLKVDSFFCGQALFVCKKPYKF